MEARKIAVIGGGTGGYSAAIRAAQLGAKVTLIEKAELGGTCLNRGCIPTKSLLHSANLAWELKSAASCGINTGPVSFDYEVARKRTAETVNRLVSGLQVLMAKNKIVVARGTGAIVSPCKARVEETGEEIDADAIVIATGSEPKALPVEGVSSPAVIDSTAALLLEQVPRKAVIIGGGAIGVEFAQMWRRMGAEVTVIEMMAQLLPGEDAEIASVLAARLQQEDVKVFVNASVHRITHVGGNGTVHFDAVGRENQASGDRVLLAAGRVPCLGGLKFTELGVALQNGAIIVNDRMETSIPGIYAAGDVVGGFMLAHVAMAEGRCAAENAMAIKSKADRSAMPRCVYTSPEFAAVGITETQAKKEHERVLVGRFPFRANGRSMVLGESVGLVKIVAEARHGEILGVHILGPCASELIAEAVLAMKLEATYKDLANTIHSHPTLSEAVMEAALGVEGLSVHI